MDASISTNSCSPSRATCRRPRLIVPPSTCATGTRTLQPARKTRGHARACEEPRENAPRSRRRWRDRVRVGCGKAEEQGVGRERAAWSRGQNEGRRRGARGRGRAARMARLHLDGRSRGSSLVATS
eukprot:6214835-Pleurochrysis_carterae.AAC.5